MPTWRARTPRRIPLVSSTVVPSNFKRRRASPALSCASVITSIPPEKRFPRIGRFGDDRDAHGRGSASLLLHAGMNGKKHSSGEKRDYWAFTTSNYRRFLLE